MWALVTGASSGIGFELARELVNRGYSVLIVSAGDRLDTAAENLRTAGGTVKQAQANLATAEGVEQLIRTINAADRPVDLLLANAGRGLGRAFLDQDLEEALKIVHTNIDGTVRLVHAVGKSMRERGAGRILITGSIAGLMPGTFQAVYNGSKAFLDSFSVALSNELKKSGVSDKKFEFFANEADFMHTAAKTPRSNCVLESSKLLACGIVMSEVHDAIAKALKNWKA